MAIDPRQVNQSFTIMGSSFVPGAGALIDRLKPNQRLALVREPSNKHHANAVRIMWGDRLLGWVPRGLADTIAPLMDSVVNVIVRKAPPLPKFGAYRGVLELAYIPPSEQNPPPERTDDSVRDGSTEEIPNVDSK